MANPLNPNPPPPTLLDRMGLNDPSASQQFLGFLDLNELSALANTSVGHKKQINKGQISRAFVLQRKGKVTLDDLDRYEEIKKEPLKSAEVRHLDLSRFSPSINDEQLQEYLDRFPNLKGLKIAGCHLLTDAALQYIAEKCPKLQHLNISFCRFTGAALQQVADRYPHLQSLKIRHCWELTDAVFQYIVEKCPKLRHLNIVSNDQLTDAAFQYIAEKCPNLQSLNIGGDRQFSDTVLQQVVSRCLHLQSLNIFMCGFNRAALQQIVHQCPYLQIIGYTPQPQSLCEKITESCKNHADKIAILAASTLLFGPAVGIATLAGYSLLRRT